MYSSITLIGRISKDVNLKYIKDSGKALCEFDIAVERKFKQSDSEIDFYPIQVWGNYGEALSNILEKGQVVLVVGSCRNERWKDDNNTTHKNFKVTAEFIKVIDFNKNKLSSIDTNSLESKLIEMSYEDNTF